MYHNILNGCIFSGLLNICAEHFKVQMFKPYSSENRMKDNVELITKHLHTFIILIRTNFISILKLSSFIVNHC